MLLGRALGARYRQQRRIRRLETILQISHDWNQTRETEPLLVQMAEAATRSAQTGQPVALADVL